MLANLFKQKFPIVLLALGFFLVTFSFLKIDDITKLQSSLLPSPIYPFFLVGMIFMGLSILFFALDQNYLAWRSHAKISRIKNGYSVKIGVSDLNVSFGQIEECEATDPDCLVALPANEFFDDECIADKASALGAYIQKAFPADVDKIRGLVAQYLDRVQFQDVEKEAGRLAKSYGIAKCVFLDKPLGSNRKILLVSVTTKRRGEGLRSEPQHLFQAMKSIQQFMVDHRFRDLHLPLMGSGHGGLRKELALLIMVLAVAETLGSTTGHNLRSVNIVLFQTTAKSRPQVSHKAVKRILSFAVSMFS